jgi:hypothetical protein
MKNLSALLRGSNYGTLPVNNGGTGVNTVGAAGNVLTSNGTTWVSQAAPISLPSQTGNATKYLTTDGTSASWVTVKTGLSATTLKTSAYTASANDLVRCNTTAGAFSITLPASPNDGDVVGILDVYSTFSTNALTVLPNGKTIESDATSYILDITGTYVPLIYNLSNTNWQILDTPAVPLTGSALGAGSNTTITGLFKGNGSVLSAAIAGTDYLAAVAPNTSGNLLTSNGTTWVSSAPPITLPTQTSNSGKYLTTDGSNASWASITTGLQVTAIKTANYTAAVNDLIRANTTSGAFTITLPASPADGATIGILDMYSLFGTNALTVVPGAGATIESDTSVVLDVNHTYAEFIYSASTTNWLWKGTPSTTSGSVTPGKSMVLSIIFG